MDSASVPYTINTRPKNDDDADVAEERANRRASIDSVDQKTEEDQTPPNPTAEFFRRCSACATLKSRNHPQSTPIKVYEYCTKSIEEGIFTDIIFLIFEFAQSPVDLIVVAGGGSGTVRRDDGGFTLPTETMVRTNVCAPLENGFYYYELKLAEDVEFEADDVVHVGWCDSRWQPQNIGMGHDAHSWAWHSNRTILHDDKVSNSFVIMGGMSPIHKDPLDLNSLDGVSSLGSMVSNDIWRLNDWRGGDVIGCGIHRHGIQFNVIFYVNGELIGEAWNDEWCDGRLYPACAIRGQHGLHRMVFGKSKMQYLPDGFEPLYSET